LGSRYHPPVHTAFPQNNTNNPKSLFTTGALSDLTIYCDNQQFSVHKLILYTQSVYFRKLFSGPWKVK
jgi:hypothetical protein